MTFPSSGFPPEKGRNPNHRFQVISRQEYQQNLIFKATNIGTNVSSAPS